jgi:hypothetical protein
VELWQVVGNFSPGVAVGVVCLYFYNAMALKYLEERKEMIEQLITEREEWNARLERLLDRYDNRIQACVSAMEKMAAETHALRGKLTEFLLGWESRLRGSGNE